MPVTARQSVCILEALANGQRERAKIIRQRPADACLDCSRCEYRDVHSQAWRLVRHDDKAHGETPVDTTTKAIMEIINPD